MNLHDMETTLDRFMPHVSLGTGPAFSMIRPALREAVKRGEFFYEYQPIVRLADRALAGYEALARWQHAGGIVQPSDFIFIAEESGTLADIQDSALTGLGASAAATPECVTFSVNWSPLQLSCEQQTERFIERIEQLHIAPSRITLEITETSMMQCPDQVFANIARLKHAGFSIALDDFGTGWCGLAYLKDLPIDRLKIDRSFVRDMQSSSKARAIVRGIIELAHELELDVVAEGIENERELERLQSMHCDFAQGYLLGRPSRSLWGSAPRTASLLPPAELMQ
jgi:EAL domain-containing protein (putative c-di-GMP-specific phosphodiesterase class I)